MAAQNMRNTTFLDLPVEIRLLIYKEFLPRRLITIDCQSRTRRTVELYGDLLPPTTLQICRQMRAEALLTYGRCEILQSCCHGYQRLYDALVDERRPKDKVYVYISYVLDTIYFEGGVDALLILPLLELDLSKIRFLAVTIPATAFIEWYLHVHSPHSKSFMLKKLFFVVPDHGAVSGRSGTLHFVEAENDFLPQKISRSIDETCGRLPDVMTFKAGCEASYGIQNMLIENDGPGLIWSLVREHYDNSDPGKKYTVCTKLSGDVGDDVERQTQCKTCLLPLE